MLVRFPFRSYSSFDFVLVLVLLIVFEEFVITPFIFILFLVVVVFGELSIVGGISWNIRIGPTIVADTSFVKILYFVLGLEGLRML